MVRVRFAPSPTGYVHIGSLRTALYNYLFARHHSGVNVLRVEDTDRTRYVEGAVDNLIRIMSWAGIAFDEGPVQGGEYGSYIQSERTELYRKSAEDLIAAGKAYYCFCSSERLDKVRKEQQATGQPPMYDRHCRNLTAEEVASRIGNGEPHVVRLRVPIGETIAVTDLVRGEVSFESKTIDDQVLMKSDGFPTYHLANVVDDHYMEISHVIRGEEWLPSTPKHILLYQGFGWVPPKFAHLPLLLNADRSKLSKRQGDVAVEDYKDKGYLPEALINFVALLGWNPSATEEIFSLQHLIDTFEIERVNKGGAVFNVEKLDWMNSEYIRKMEPEDLLPLVKPIVADRGYDMSDDHLLRVIKLMHDRARTINDFVDFCLYFYRAPTEYDEKYKLKHWNEAAKTNLGAMLPEFKALESWNKEGLEEIVRRRAESGSISAGKLIHPIRLAVSGIGMGPGLFELLEVLGREESIARMERAVAELA